MRTIGTLLDSYRCIRIAGAATQGSVDHAEHVPSWKCAAQAMRPGSIARARTVTRAASGKLRPVFRGEDAREVRRRTLDSTCTCSPCEAGATACLARRADSSGALCVLCPDAPAERVAPLPGRCPIYLQRCAHSRDRGRGDTVWPFGHDPCVNGLICRAARQLTDTPHSNVHMYFHLRPLAIARDVRSGQLRGVGDSQWRRPVSRKVWGLV